MGGGGVLQNHPQNPPDNGSCSSHASDSSFLVHLYSPQTNVSASGNLGSVQDPATHMPP